MSWNLQKSLEALEREIQRSALRIEKEYGVKITDINLIDLSDHLADDKFKYSVRIGYKNIPDLYKPAKMGSTLSGINKEKT